MTARVVVGRAMCVLLSIVCIEEEIVVHVLCAVRLCTVHPLCLYIIQSRDVLLRIVGTIMHHDIKTRTPIKEAPRTPPACST